MYECWSKNCYVVFSFIFLLIYTMSLGSYATISEERLCSIQAQVITSLCWFPIAISAREELTAWIRRVSATVTTIPSQNAQPLLLSDIRLCPTQTSGGAMLECAKEVGERGTHLSYGGIFRNPKEYFPQTKRSRGNSRPIGRSHDRNGQEKKRRSRKMSKRNVGRDVFLGGSCNPTTWRKDEAIPLLESLGITYFNPQVAEWTADLVAVEHNAKESASVLFYVLDRRTRNVVGIIEAANFAGSQRNLVLVTDPYKEGEPVAGENISHVEYEELCSGLSTLHDLVARQGIVVHNNITDAIKWTAKFLSSHNSQNKTSFGEELRKDKELLDKTAKSEINISNVCHPYYLSSNNKAIKDLNGITTKVNRGLCQGSQNGTLSFYDIYIGGSCFDQEWKENTAVPILRQSRLKYTFAECGLLKNSRANQQEVCLMESSKVLLFIITSRTRGLETMVLASYYIGCGKDVILCIQNLTENAVIENEMLSKVAINDYNRGRVYLRDVATRSGVPVYDSIPDAVQAAVVKCSNCKNFFR